MGTADYCALVTLLLAVCIGLSIRQEEKRGAERRQRCEPPPGGIDRRVLPNRRSRSFKGWIAWVAQSQWRKARKHL